MVSNVVGLVDKGQKGRLTEGKTAFEVSLYGVLFLI